MAISLVKNARTIDDWAEKISEAWQDNVASIFAVGNMLESAREELGYAQFAVLRRDKLKYGKSTVHRLVAIATDDKLRDVAHVQLPACWGTLYELTKLTDEQFAAALECGAIHAGMERKDVKALRPPKEKKAPIPETLRQVERFAVEVSKKISSYASQLTPTEKAEFINIVRMQLDDMASDEKREAA